VDAGESLHQLGIAGGENLAFGVLELRIARRKIERDLLRSSVDQEVGVRRFDAAKIVEIVRLAWGDEPGRLRNALEDRNAVIADRREDARPTGLELVRRKVSLVPGVRLR